VGTPVQPHLAPLTAGNLIENISFTCGKPDSHTLHIGEDML
jgi:hypothetical protein